MKFEVRTEPVCVVLVAVPAYFSIAIAAITIVTGIQAHDAWFPLTVIVTILSIAITFVYAK